MNRMLESRPEMPRSALILRITLLAAAIGVVSLLHYHTTTHQLLLHQFFQRAYYLPILLASLWFGWRGGLVAAALSGSMYAPHILLAWQSSPSYSANQYIEIVMFVAVATVTGVLADHERGHRRKVEQTAQQLAEVNAQLQSSFEQLRRADRLAAVGELSAGLAHEIRNPLGSIEAAVQILCRKTVADETRQEFGGLAAREINRLKDLVTSFLEFARPPAPRLVSTSPAEVVEAVRRLAAETARLAKIELRTELEEIGPAPLDPEQIKQVLLNLVLNAIQAMPDGGTIVLRAYEGEGNLVLEVVDQGRGVRQEDIERIFDPFFTTRAEGTGLGLSIAYRIVAQHGGDIVAVRNADRGMTMRITIRAAYEN